MRLYLDHQQLQNLALKHREQYRTAAPFPHVVLDGALPSEALDCVLNEFPENHNDIWREYNNYHEKKLECQGEEKLSENVSLVLYQFNGAPFLQFLETLTGIDKLIPDPYFFGGGLHMIEPGGKLGIHADFSRHNRLPLERRLNVLIYLNKNWREEYGGQLELWNDDMTRCVQKIFPAFNRMVIFTITDWAFHGHPEPLACPPGLSRKSIALYYYTVGRPRDQLIKGKTSTLFMPRPDETVPEDTLRFGLTYQGKPGIKPTTAETPQHSKSWFQKLMAARSFYRRSRGG